MTTREKIEVLRGLPSQSELITWANSQESYNYLGKSDIQVYIDYLEQQAEREHKLYYVADHSGRGCSITFDENELREKWAGAISDDEELLEDWKQEVN